MSEPTLHFEWVDVFTDRPFAGNPLAVFSEPGELSTRQMQSIARELNLSETTFVQPPSLNGCDFKVRIFTPTSELPMAGHPTLGTAHVLAAQGKVESHGAPTRVVFEEGVGPIEVDIEWSGGEPGRIVMTQPSPQFGRVLEDRSLIADLLGLSESDLAELPIQVVSTGPPFLFVPLASLAAAEATSLRLDAWRQHLSDTDAQAVYVFSLETVDASADVHGRLFAPGYGIVEDPATGSAVGPLGAYLVHHGVVAGAGDKRIDIEQGLEMGRPSRLEVEVVEQDAEMAIRVGGLTASVAEGHLNRPPAA